MSSITSLPPTSSISPATSISNHTLTPLVLSPRAGGSQHPSRPSLAISYSQVPSNWSSAFTPSNAGIRVGADPNPSTGALPRAQMRPQVPTSTMSSSAATTSPVVAGGGGPPKQFVVPAHPQSHHLHSLPPREKTTRTLILDHTTWRHGRTRFAQGRCELGMKVRFKNQENCAETLDSEDGKRSGFYIGLPNASRTGYKRPSDFGEPPEIDIASSDEEGESGAFCHFDGEKVCALAYGRRFRQKRKEALKKARAQNCTGVDLEEDFSSISESDEDEPHAFARPEDAHHAPLLAARAVGMEKVIRSMLIQRPASPPRSPSPPPYGIQGVQAAKSAQPPKRSPSNSSMLPNGLRLRLSLSALVNDLFERQPSLSASRPSDSNNAQAVPTLALSPTSPSTSPPAGLAPLAQVSSQPFYAPPTLPSFHTLSLPSASSSSNLNKLSSPSPQSAHPPTSFGGASAEQRRPPPLFSWTRPTTTAVTSPTSPNPPISVAPGADRSSGTPSSRPPASGITSTLPGSWTEVISRPSAFPAGKATPLSKRAVGRSRDLYALGCYVSPSSVKTTNSFQRNVPTYSYSNAAPPKPIPEYPVEKLKTLCPRHLHEKCRICEPITPAVTIPRGSIASSGRPSTRIGAGLLKKELRGGDGTGSVLADLIPRFLRLSALVAMELGREARGEEPEMDESQRRQQEHASNDSNVAGASASVGPSKPASTTLSQQSQAQPTRAWFGLVCGLITRGVLEGYVARGWKGAEYAEVLMGVGLGIRGVGTRRPSTGFGASNGAPNSVSSLEPGVDEDKDSYEPDEMPTLVEACKILFNGLVQDMRDPDSKEKITSLAEQEYISEMEERMSELLTIPHAAPDLATHLTELSNKYPAEPVERAALRFCEAVANWRGKPELEMYKKLTKQNSSKSETSTPVPPPLTLNALLASSPAPDRPPIHKYFRILSVTRKSVSPPTRILKRQRSMEEDGRETKKEKVEGDQSNAAMEVDAAELRDKPPSVQAFPDPEWVGPYGV